MSKLSPTIGDCLHGIFENTGSSYSDSGPPTATGKVTSNGMASSNYY